MLPLAPPSVSRRLLFAVAIPVLLFFALTFGAIDLVFQRTQDAALRDSLHEQVVALVTAVDPDPNGRLIINVLDPDSRLNVPRSGRYATLREADGRLLWSSASLSDTGLVLGARLPVGGVDFRYERARDGALVAVLSEGLQVEFGAGVATHKLVFTAAESFAPQLAQRWRFRSQLATWFGALTVALLVTMAWMMRRALSPVRRLEQEIADVETGTSLQLGGGYPRELAGVTQGLNALLESERSRIARYRDTLGNLAHSLKTPLAVMRASLGGESSPTPAAAAAIQLEIDRMAQIIEHQLKRASAGGGVTLGQAPIVILRLLTDLRVALLKVHARKDLRIDLECAADLAFLGDQGDIVELLGNIVDNACKWCRSCVSVTVALDDSRELSQRLSIVVEDDGPGIAPADRVRVIERGVRTDEHVPGHGLGLSMVRETVVLYGGRFFIDKSAGQGGARVELQLPGRRTG